MIRPAAPADAPPRQLTGHNGEMAQWVTLEEWAQRHDLSLTTVRTEWVYEEGFPPHAQYRERAAGTGSGGRHREYDPAQLDAWLARWQSEHRPSRHAMPEDPEEYRTLGAIARLLGLDGKTVTQYRDLIDHRAEFEDKGARRRYRTRDVVDFLNDRPGYGRSSDPARDRRRNAAR
ncbi:hypothetical protein [Nocardia sp. NPDC056100]|uniref:hypothetical protein n=1 Tax=Nocardia sp. NPDC056100 TaxID=3345712 RepID=UPI0035D67C83